MSDSQDTAMSLRRLTLAVVNLTSAVNGLMRTLGERHGLNDLDFQALAALTIVGTASNGQLVGLLNTNPGTVARILDKLDQRGLLERERPPEDRRTVLNSLSPEGRELTDAMAREMEMARTVLLAGATDEQVRVFVEVLELIGANRARLQAGGTANWPALADAPSDAPPD